MHALFFEMRPHPGHLEHYFEHVALLRPVLAQQKGLAFLDRYGALGDSDLLLSHQLWDSEAAIVAWRQETQHRAAQAAGRRVHFADYRIRVGARVLHLQGGALTASPADEAARDAPHVLAVYGAQPHDVPGFTAFESLNHKGKFVALASFAGFAFAEAALQAQIGAPGLEEAALYSIRRDYGPADRAQAPQ